MLKKWDLNPDVYDSRPMILRADNQKQKQVKKTTLNLRLFNKHLNHIK